MNARYTLLPLFSALVLGACNQQAGDVVDIAPGAKDAGGTTSAIVPPDEASDAALPPSYEVAIASAASDRNQALENCEAQPESMRAKCAQEANVAFAEVEAGLQDLRGNQQ
jgi:hypothetical protein